MFQDYFLGLSGKGPVLFWEKAWKSINKESYNKYTVPIIDAFIYKYQNLFSMQDYAPGHAAKLIIAEFEKREIRLIFWPPFSPDLNLIKTV